MLTISSLELERTLVSANAKIGDVRLHCRPHGPRAVAVVESGVFLGLIDCRMALYMDPEVPVRLVLQQSHMRFEASTPVRRIAQEFLTYDLDYAPVFNGEEYLGLVNTPMLLREVGRSWDPLTGLGWSDRLREWGIGRLRGGQDISILFIDLDEFGHYNKKYGHIVGDYVLQIISARLKDFIDPDIDVLVRYGGDEFVICTTRSRDEAEQLARRIEHGMGGLKIEEQPDPIGFSIGIFGGRRSIERDQVHYAATMDNLINLASKDCIARKLEKRPLSMIQV
ncbi:MAG: GGDEF domain-containing protein [Fimbriimonas sp.]